MICAVALISLLAVQSAFAHAQLTMSTPENKASLKESPAQVDLWFNELLDEGFNSVEVYPATELNAKLHTNMVMNDPRVDEKSQNHIVARLKPLQPGDYIVDYRVLSRDGHTAPGRITFTILATK